MRHVHVGLIATVLALAAGTACAAGGRINFNGMVLEPTCSVDAAVLSTAPQGTAQQVCGQSASGASIHFERRVQTLDASITSSDRLLGYYASYAPLNTNGQLDAKLVVRTYE